MEKRHLIILLGFTAALALSGCGKSSDTSQKTAVPPVEKAESTSPETENLYGDTENFETLVTEENTELYSDTVAPITPSDYLTADASDYVQLTSYDGLEVTRYMYSITDDMIQNQILTAREEVSTENEIDTPAESGDTVYLTLKSTVRGSSEEAEPEDTYLTIGDEDYGAEFDRQLTGVSTGDTKTFSITFGDDIWIEEWIGQTVDFEASVTGVTRLFIPEYDEDFLSTYTDYTSKEDYEAAIRASLEEEYTEISYSDAIEQLFTEAIEKTAFSGYPQELYDTCREESLASYAMFAGDDSTDISDVLEAFGITQEDIDDEALGQTNRRLFVSAYCKANDISVTEDEYLSFLEENAEYYGLSGAAEFESLYTRDAIVWNLYESKAAAELYQHASVTEETYAEPDPDEFITEDAS